MICIIWKVCSSQKRDNNNTSQLLPSVQEGLKAEGMKLELAEFPVFSGQGRRGTSQHKLWDAPGNLPSCSSRSELGIFTATSDRTSCHLGPCRALHKSPWYALLSQHCWLTDHCLSKESLTTTSTLNNLTESWKQQTLRIQETGNKTLHYRCPLSIC